MKFFRYIKSLTIAIGYCILHGVCSAGTAHVGSADPACRTNVLLDEGWSFHLGDIPIPIPNGLGSSYDSAKAGNAGGAAALNYDDSEWRTVTLPHDWAVESPFDKEANPAQGYRHRGIAWN